jgi:hypothetical protein
MMIPLQENPTLAIRLGPMAECRLYQIAHLQWASLIAPVGVSNFAHTPLIRHASAAKASESMAVFSDAAFDWKKRAIHNLYWVVAIEER